MELTVTLPAIIATIALIIAFRNYYLSNYVVVRFMYCTTHGTYESGKMVTELKFVIQNLGVPLHDLSMRLEFAHRGACVLSSKNHESIRKGTFHKGMITNFSFVSNDLTHMAIQMLTEVTDIEKDKPVLILFSDDFEVWRHPFHSEFSWYKKQWNRFATYLRFGIAKPSAKNPKGYPNLRGVIKLPKFDNSSSTLLVFIQALRLDAKNAAIEVAEAKKKSAAENANKSPSSIPNP